MLQLCTRVGYFLALYDAVFDECDILGGGGGRLTTAKAGGIRNNFTMSVIWGASAIVTNVMTIGLFFNLEGNASPCISP